ncbi:MAG: hypothetical protein IT445_09325 [Phycisphaeraceae bacterium]|nr:hypothetical protein [Phycisphaeraceae bacterium]
MQQSGNHWPKATMVLAAMGLGLWLGRTSLTPQASAQAGSDLSKVEAVQEGDVMLGAGDVRFGVAIEPDGAAVVSNSRNYHAIFVTSDGQARDLGIRLRHPHAAAAIPPNGIAVIEDMQGDYFAISATGRIQPLADVR